MRIFEFKPADESTIVEKILVHVHKSVDSHLPHAIVAPRRYSKTVFSEEESTALVKVAADHDREQEAKAASKPAVPTHSPDKSKAPPIPIPDDDSVSIPSPVQFKNSTLSKSNDQADDPQRSRPIRASSTTEQKRTDHSTQFSTSFEYTEPKINSNSKDLLLIILGLVLVIGLGVGYWIMFESG